MMFREDCQPDPEDLLTADAKRVTADKADGAVSGPALGDPVDAAEAKRQARRTANREAQQRHRDKLKRNDGDPEAATPVSHIDARALLEARIADVQASIAAVSKLIEQHNRSTDHRLRMDLSKTLSILLERYRRTPAPTSGPTLDGYLAGKYGSQ
jgi:hypothetical protein